MKNEGSRVLADYVVQFGSVAGSSLGPDTGSERGVLYSVVGVGVADEEGEIDDSADVFGSLGLVGRPLPPRTVRGRTTHAEVACLRTADGLIPIAARDLRTRMGGSGPNEGTIALVGYGGGFHSLDVVLDGSGDPIGTIHVVYCPYDLDADGIPQKAHVITLDPTSGNESLSIVHAEGQAILMQNDGTARIQSPDGQSYIQVKNKEVAISADQLVLNGSIFLGNPTTTYYPVGLLAGPASQACPRLFLNATP